MSVLNTSSLMMVGIYNTQFEKMRTKGSIKMTYVFETINWNKKKEKDPCDGCYGSCNGCPYKNY